MINKLYWEIKNKLEGFSEGIWLNNSFYFYHYEVFINSQSITNEKRKFITILEFL